MTRGEIAKVLKEIAGLMRLRGDEPFRVRAIETAARSIERTMEPPAELLSSGKLMEIPGVGKTVAAIVGELCETGRSSMHDALTADVPPGLPALLRIPGLGTTRVRELRKTLGIGSIDELERAIDDDRLSSVKGFGPRTIETVREGIRFVRSVEGRSHYPFALEDAFALRARIRALPDVHRVEISGALRRARETVGRIDLLVAAADPAEMLAHAARLDIFPTDPEIGADEALFRFASGVSGRVRAVPPEGFAAAWVWETGAPEHQETLAARADERGFAFDRAGFRMANEPEAFSTEEEVYEALGLAWIPPEIREGGDEIARAANGSLPTLVEETDLTGAFHCHTDWSDGKATLVEMAAAARGRGWGYLGIADHSRSASYANGLHPGRVERQQADIDRLNASDAGVRLFKGVESDILPDGSLDYDDDLLATFDYLVGSVHSNFGMDRSAMTDRLLAAVRNPYLTMLGHPTGRLLLRREPYDVDLRRVLAAAIEAGVIVEINANPWRLDLDWREVRWAAEQGALFAINPDAHSTEELAYVTFGVKMARKGGLEAEQIINCWSLERIEAHLADRRARAERSTAG